MRIPFFIFLTEIEIHKRHMTVSVPFFILPPPLFYSSALRTKCAPACCRRQMFVCVATFIAFPPYPPPHLTHPRTHPPTRPWREGSARVSKSLRDSSAAARSLRSPTAGLELDVQGSRKRDPDAPGGSDPHPACWRPEPGGAALRLWAQALPSTPVRKALSTVWVVGQAGRRVGWPRPPVTSPPLRLAGPSRRAVRRPARGRAGWA